jgi:hypothetical protein
MLDAGYLMLDGIGRLCLVVRIAYCVVRGEKIWTRSACPYWISRFSFLEKVNRDFQQSKNAQNVNSGVFAFAKSGLLLQGQIYRKCKLKNAKINAWNN